MGPEFLVAGLIAREGLLLCVGLGNSQNGEDGAARNNGSIEYRFHRVTPYAAADTAAPVIYFERSQETYFWSGVRRPDHEFYHILSMREARGARACKVKTN
jgi:hypothetical protein